MEFSMPRSLKRQVLSDADKQTLQDHVSREALNNGKRKEEIVRLRRLLEFQNRRQVPYALVAEFCESEFGTDVS